MRKYFRLLNGTLLAAFIFIVSYKLPASTYRQFSNTLPTKDTLNKCNQTIKYYSNKVKLAEGGQDMSMNTEIIINPSDKTIVLSSEPPDQEKVSFTTIIESFDCSLNSNLTSGQALYKGYIKQLDGSMTEEVIRIEIDNGVLSISNGSPEKESNFSIVISKWEVINE